VPCLGCREPTRDVRAKDNLTDDAHATTPRAMTHHTGRIASEFQALRATCDELKRVNEDQKHDIATLRRERDQMSAQCGALRATLDGGKRERQTLMQKQKELEDAMEDIKANQSRTGALLEESKGNYGVASKLVDDRVAEDKAFVDGLKKMTEDWNAQTGELTQLKAENRRLSADLGDLQCVHKEAMTEFVALKELTKTNDETRAALQSTVEELSASLKTKDTLIVELEKEHAKVADNWNKMMAEKTALYERTLETKDEELEREYEKRASATKIMSEWEVRNSELSRSISNLKRDLEKKARDHDKIKSEYAELRANSTRAASKAADRNIEYEELKSSLAKAETTIDELNEHVESLEMQQNALKSSHKGEMEAIQLAASNAQKVADARSEEIAALKHQLADVQQTAEDERAKLKAERIKVEQSLELASKKQVQAEVEAAVERINKQNKDYINKKDKEHAMALEQNAKEIERLHSSVEELKEQLEVERKKVEQPMTSRKTTMLSSSKQARHDIHTPNITASPKLGSKRRARARPMPNIVTYGSADDEEEEEEDVDFAVPAPLLVVREPSKKRTKTAKTVNAKKLSKRMLKEQIRSSRHDDEEDPFEFDGDDLFA